MPRPKPQGVPLFAESFDQWLASWRGALMADAESHYPGDDATPDQVRDAAREVGQRHWLKIPELVPGTAGVTLQPFDSSVIPEHVPGRRPDPVRMVRIRLLVTGDTSVLTCKPGNATRGGWPAATVEPGAVALVVPDDEAVPRRIDEFRAAVADGLAYLANNVAHFIQPVGLVAEAFKERQAAAKRRRAADAAARNRLANLGYPVISSDDRGDDA